MNADSDLKVSIAVIELIGGDVMRRSLERLQRMARRYPVNVYAVFRGDPGAGFENRLFPDVTMIAFGGDSVPQRRKAALTNSNSELVGLVEDTIELSECWIDGVMESFSDQRVCAAWGPIDIAAKLAPRHRALGVMEYGRYSPNSSEARGAAAGVPGCNMAFRRSEALAVLEQEEGGLNEHRLVARLSSHGFIAVRHLKMLAAYSVADHRGARLSTRMAHGRLYGGIEGCGLSAGKRMLAALRSFLAPVVLMLRGIRHSLNSSGDKIRPVELMWIAMMSIAWGAGEVYGFLTGPGDATRSWR